MSSSTGAGLLVPISPTLPSLGPCSSLAALPCYKACVAYNQNPLSWLFSRKRPKLQHATYSVFVCLFVVFLSAAFLAVFLPCVASLGAVPWGLSLSLGSCAAEGGPGLRSCEWFTCGWEGSAAETSFVRSFGHSACFPVPSQRQAPSLPFLLFCPFFKVL